MQASGDTNMHDLRERIWDYLFEVKSAQSIIDLASLAKCDETTIRIAVDHEWFTKCDDQISIAHVETYR